MLCLGKNNLTTSQVIKKNNEKGKSLKNSHVRAKISNGYWQGFTSVEVSNSQFLNTKSFLQALRLVNDRSDYPIIFLCTSCYIYGDPNESMNESCVYQRELTSLEATNGFTPLEI